MMLTSEVDLRVIQAARAALLAEVDAMDEVLPLAGGGGWLAVWRGQAFVLPDLLFVNFEHFVANHLKVC